ncbi:MAG: transporter [Nitrospinaceae bacterium]|nr:MAG: transporter [Nitrospinaceae bacterium]
MNSVEKIFLTLANAFPAWVLTGASLALWQPATAMWFEPGWIPLFLGVIMLSMGLTLDFKDFLQVFKIPKSILLGVSLQYIIMPALGYGLSKAFHLPIDYMIGLVLVACCPGGTASNVVCFIARTNVALSVSLTTFSTLLAVFFTPVLTTLLIESLSKDLLGTAIRVDTMGLLINTLKIVILPVLAGVFLNHYFHGAVKKINPYTPLLAVLSIVFIVDYILAAKKTAILETGFRLLTAILILHTLGFLLGYLLSRLLKFRKKDAETVSIEVGMQNSGLATELARSNFPGYALATVPGAISALTHCVLGSIAAGLCRIKAGKTEPCNYNEDRE